MRASIRRPGVAAVVLLATYIGLALLNDPGGTLGTDTGAKVYTLEIMTARDTASPEIGYWAEELDPDGSVHPVHQTARTDDGWVAVTTLPMLEAAAPLYDLGGYRMALVLPMLGAVATALAARALARQMDPDGDGAVAMWMVGLASPVVVYALDLWEHTLGVACVAWALVLLLRIVEGGSVAPALGAGALLGLGAVMRNEVLVYALVSVGVTCVLILRDDRRLPRSLLTGATAVVGFGAAFLANAALEGWVGGLSRADRATGTASSATSVTGSELRERLEEALQTSIGLVAGDPVLAGLLGGGVVLAVLLAVRAERRGDRFFAGVALAAAGAVYLADAVGGLGFVPGLFVAFPVAVLALVPVGRSAPASTVTAVALLALPVVYAFQYLGGAGPQWGGRYTLASAILLGVVATTCVVPRLRLVGPAVLSLSVLVSALGVAWLWERSHAVDRFFEEVGAISEPVLVARQAFLLREAGAELVGRRWLSASDEGEFAEAVEVARRSGQEAFTVLQWDGEALPPGSVPRGVREVDRHILDFLGTTVGVVTYRFVPS